MTDRPYSRVYHSIADDPMFAEVYRDREALGAWLQMLLVADAMYPTSAPLPRSNRAVTSLIDAGLVILLPGNRYTIRGLKAERERRSASARNAAAVRWHSEGNAKAMPRRDETSKDKTSTDANASESSGVFMGMRPKAKADAEDVRRQHEEDWTAKCADCGILKRKHSAGGEHPFRPELRSVS
jgi:hypothetical protein